MGTVGFKAPLGWDRSGATATFSWGLLAAAKKHHCIVHGKVKFRNLSKVIWLGVPRGRKTAYKPRDQLRTPLRGIDEHSATTMPHSVHQGCEWSRQEARRQPATRTVGFNGNRRRASPRDVSYAGEAN